MVRESGRAERIPAREVRRRMILRGAEILRDEGLSAGLSQLGIDRVAEEEGLPRSSAFGVFRRVGDEWDEESDDLSPQFLFHRAVVHAVITDEPQVGRDFQDAKDAAVRVLERHGEATDRAALDLIKRDLLREGGQQSIRWMAQSRLFRLIRGIEGIEASKPDGVRDELITTWLADQDAQLRETVVRDVYAPLAIVCQLAPKRDLVGDDPTQEAITQFWDRFAIAVSALIEGIGARYEYEDVDLLENIQRDPNDELWSLFSLALEALVDGFFEPIESGS